MADGSKVDVQRVTVNSLAELNTLHAEQEKVRREAMINNNPRAAILRAALTNNIGATDLIRTEFLRFMLDGPREIDADCGYPAWLTPDHYRALYDREGHAARVVHCEPEESWANDPDLYEDNPQRSAASAADADEGEDENADGEPATPFERAWDALEVKFNLWYHLQRIDILSGIGQFGIILFGLDDGAGLEEPVEGFNDDGTVSGNPKHELMYLRPFDESVVFVKTREVDVNNPRYGHPTMYSVQFRDFPNWGVQAGEVIARDIHWTRVLHVADNRKMSEIYGIPRMQQVYNRLYDLRKVCSADGEAFWKGGFPGISFEINPEIADQGEVLDKDSLRDEMAAYQNGLQRYFAVQGVTAKTMQPALADPTPHVEMQLKMIAIAKSIPYRILFGTEEAKLAGEQDSRSWNKRVARRQNKYVTPMVIRPFIDRLIDYGMLPKPAKPYTVKWPDLNTPTASDKAAVALQKTQAMGTYVQQGVSQIVGPEQFLTHVMGEEQDVVDDMLDSAGDDMAGTGETEMGDPDYMGGDEGDEQQSESNEGGLNDTNVIGADALEQRDLSGHTTIGPGKAKNKKRVDATWVSQPELNAERKPERKPAKRLPQEPEDLDAPDLEDVEYTMDRPTGNEKKVAPGRWVTIEHTHVFIQGGKITKGPSGMMGKTPGQLPARRAAEKTSGNTPPDEHGHSTERVPSDPAAGAYWAGAHAADRAGKPGDDAHAETQAALVGKDTHKHILRDEHGRIIGAIGYSARDGAVRVSHVGSHVSGGEAKLMAHANAHGEERGLPVVRDASKSAAPPVQPVSTKEELYAHAADAKKHYDDLVAKKVGRVFNTRSYNDFGKAMADIESGKKGKVVILAPLKGEKRAEEKVNADYGGNWNRLTDMVRGTIAVDHVGELEPVLNGLKETAAKNGFTVVAHSDKYANPTPAGYRDHNLRLRGPNGHISELQINTKPMIRAKEGRGHKIYEEQRSLEAKAALEGRDLTPAEAAHRDALEAESRALYARAYHESQPPTK